MSLDLSLGLGLRARSLAGASTSTIGRVLVGIATQQSITANTPTAIEYDAAPVYDLGGWHDDASPELLTVPAGGGLVRYQSGSRDSQAGTQYEQQISSAQAGVASGSSGTDGDQWTNLTSALIEVAGGETLQTVITTDANGIVYVDGATYAAAELVTDVAERVLVTKSTGQTLNAATNTLITFDQEEYDTDGFHDNVTNNSRLIAPSDGFYRVGTNIDTPLNNSQVVVELFKDGVAGVVGMGGRDVEFVDAKAVNHWSAPVEFTAGQFAEVSVYSNAALVVNANEHTWLTMERCPDYSRALTSITADQAIPANTETPVQWNAADTYDTDSIHDPAVNNTKMIAPAGVSEARIGYFLKCGPITEQKLATLHQNGALVTGSAGHDAQTTGLDYLSGMSPWLPCAPGDEFEVLAFSQGAFDIWAAGTFFWAEFR